MSMVCLFLWLAAAAMQAADPLWLLVQVTHIFRDVLHGWGQILLSVNISPDAADYDETAHVLRVRHLDRAASSRLPCCGQMAG